MRFNVGTKSWNIVRLRLHKKWSVETIVRALEVSTGEVYVAVSKYRAFVRDGVCVGELTALVPLPAIIPTPIEEFTTSDEWAASSLGTDLLLKKLRQTNQFYEDVIFPTSPLTQAKHYAPEHSTPASSLVIS